jgi:transposase-like protein
MMDGKDPVFRSEDAAIRYLESIRWPHGVQCPACESLNILRMSRSPQPGEHMCRDCRRQFNVKAGTLFEGTRTPLHKWLHVFYVARFMGNGRDGENAHKLHRYLGLTYKTVRRMTGRVEYAVGCVQRAHAEDNLPRQYQDIMRDALQFALSKRCQLPLECQTDTTNLEG